MSKEIEEAILEATEARENPTKAESIIAEFGRKLVEETDIIHATEWIKDCSHELGLSEMREDLHEAISTNYFRLGFVVGRLHMWRLLQLKNAKK